MANTRKSYVVGFLFSDDQRYVVLIRKNKPDWQKGLLNGVGGKIEGNELPSEAMTREFQEEAGMHITDWRQLCLIETLDKSALVYFYYAFVPLKELHPTSMTDELVGLFRVKGIHEIPCIPNLNWLIYLCLDPNHVCGTLTCTNSMK